MLPTTRGSESAIDALTSKTLSSGTQKLKGLVQSRLGSEYQARVQDARANLVIDHLNRLHKESLGMLANDPEWRDVVSKMVISVRGRFPKKDYSAGNTKLLFRKSGSTLSQDKSGASPEANSPKPKDRINCLHVAVRDHQVAAPVSTKTHAAAPEQPVKQPVRQGQDHPQIFSEDRVELILSLVEPVFTRKWQEAMRKYLGIYLDLLSGKVPAEPNWHDFAGGADRVKSIGVMARLLSASLRLHSNSRLSDRAEAQSSQSFRVFGTPKAGRGHDDGATGIQEFLLEAPFRAELHKLVSKVVQEYDAQNPVPDDSVGLSWDSIEIVYDPAYLNKLEIDPEKDCQ